MLLTSAPVCPGCLAPLRPPLVRCSLCSLPVCSPVCAASPSHKPECKLLSENRVKVPVSIVLANQNQKPSILFLTDQRPSSLLLTLSNLQLNNLIKESLP